ncbi:MAG: PAS domain S-box protein, partial [Gemmatimonadaceae bacterium]
MVSQNILIVGGEPVVSKDLEDRLTHFGYNVSAVAPSADAAIAVSVRGAPDVVMMNALLPSDAPSFVIEELQRRWRCPIVFLIPEHSDAHARTTGVRTPYDCVAEPFTERELRTSLELALLRHDQMRTVREMEDRYFANSIDLLCFLDFSGYFKRLNPAWERTLGFTCEELMSKPFIEFVHPDDRERTLSQNAAVRAGGQALAFENRYLCKDGSYRWFLWNATPDSVQRVIYSMARDITASKRAQEERELLVRELQS